MSTSVDEGSIEELRLQFIEEATLELEADFEVNAEVAKSGVLAKLCGTRDIPKGRLKQILTGVWSLRGKWRMKTLEKGVWGFFFDQLEDKEEVLKRRPWIIAGQLLNIREWPSDGSWFNVSLNKAVFWVEIHGLPTPYLVFQNSRVIGAKVGEFLGSDGVDNRTIARRGFLKLKVDIMIDQRLPAGFYLSITRGRREWIQFKYRKLPKICFNCGYLAHDRSECRRDKAFAYPPVGNAVPLYGPWIKATVPIRNCFDTKGPSLLRDRPEREVDIQEKRNIPSTSTGPHTEQGTEVCDEPTILKAVGEGTECTKDEANRISKHSPEGMTTVKARDVSTPREKEHPMNNLGKNPEDENVLVCMMAHVGPDAAQVIEKPHFEVCKSRTPHHHPEPTIIKGPIQSVEELTEKMTGPLLVESNKVESGSNWFHSNSVVTTGSKSKKRKATGNVSPIIFVDSRSSETPSKLKGLAEETKICDISPFSIGTSTPKKGSTGSRKLRNRKISNGKDHRTICEGVCTITSSGEEVDVWWQPWIPWMNYEDFRALMENVRQKAPSLLCVADLMYRRTRSWNVGYLRYLFGSDLGSRISTIQIDKNGDHDILIWKDSDVGRFSVKGAYWLHQKSCFGVPSKLWKWIWYSKVHPRLSLMIWRAVSDSLPTGSRISTSDLNSCPICKSAAETPMHLFCRCPFAVGIWFSSPLPLRMDDIPGTSLSEVIFNLIEHLDSEGRNRMLCCVGIVISCIWNYRNALMHPPFAGPSFDKVRRDIHCRFFELSHQELGNSTALVTSLSSPTFPVMRSKKMSSGGWFFQFWQF
ncbi:hypothetical protein G4B88_026949 [Cannabis sativa]|uniref:CCHC-type domain-containing protein n=1 Tax=Cannabis sativa TaxID=3483 RepID=A0A7J6EIM5_CANSA|nr:hypothetical protein G4B88_026949 [Cannabis sativa]